MGVWTLNRSTGETQKLLSGTSPKEIDILDENRAVYGDFVGWSPIGDRVLLTKFEYGGTVEIILDLSNGFEAEVSLRGVGGTTVVDFVDNETLLGYSSDAGPSEESIYTAPVQGSNEQSAIYRTGIENLSSVVLSRDLGRVFFSVFSNLDFSQAYEEVPPPKLKDNALYLISLAGSDLLEHVYLGYDPENRLGIPTISISSSDKFIAFVVDYSPSSVSGNDELWVLNLETNDSTFVDRGDITLIEWFSHAMD